MIVDYKHQLVETEYNMSITVCCCALITMIRFLIIIILPRALKKK